MRPRCRGRAAQPALGGRAWERGKTVCWNLGKACNRANQSGPSGAMPARLHHDLTTTGQPPSLLLSPPRHSVHSTLRYPSLFPGKARARARARARCPQRLRSTSPGRHPSIAPESLAGSRRGRRRGPLGVHRSIIPHAARRPSVPLPRHCSSHYPSQGPAGR